MRAASSTLTTLGTVVAGDCVDGRPWQAGYVRPSLYDFAGGEAAFLALAAAHHARCLADPELNHPFSHPDQHPQHVERLAAYWAEVMGGPPTYSSSCGDNSFVLRLHAGNGDLTDLGRRFVACFVAAADDARLPDDPEFRAALRAYMEWAVGEVLLYGPPDATVPADLPMPHWSWDGLVD
jgi:hemoglobin